MRESNIPNKILKWYDNNKRMLPWSNKISIKNSVYFILFWFAFFLYLF